MRLKVIYLPALIPFVKSRNCYMPNLAPPERMRAIWIGQQFFGNGYTAGGYRYERDKDAKVKKFIYINGQKIDVTPKKLVTFGDPKMKITWHLDYDESMEIIKKATSEQFIIDWYKYRWPDNSPFIFSDHEVKTFRGPIDPPID